MTGDEAYHADCFRCTQCDSKIDDLVFAKTSQGIYCMKCHQERKEAKRQREERERMERVERALEKSLPTIPEAEKHTQSEPARPYPDMLRPPLSTQSNHFGAHGYSSAQSEPTPRVDSRPKATTSGLPTVDVGPPFLPPLTFGLDDTVSSGFDLGDMLSSSEKDSKDSSPSTPSTPSSKEVQLVNGQDRSSFRLSIARADARLSTSSLNGTNKTGVNGIASKSLPGSPNLNTPVATKRISDRFVPSIPSSASLVDSIEDVMSPADAAALIRDLRTELAKYNPMSPLIHGTPQQEYGLLVERTEKLMQKHAQLEKAVRDLYIEKDLLGMDLEAMNEELKVKEEALANNSTDKLQPAAATTPNPRMSTSHDFVKQAYQMEVKALQEQKERLQREIQTYVEQRDGVLDEMQILSVRNAELSTINNDMMRELQERKDPRSVPPAAPSSTANSSSGGSMLQSFTGKMRRQRQASGGNQQELKAPQLSVARSSDSTYSFNSTNSDDGGRQTSKGRREEDIQEDIFGEEIVAPKKFNWKKGTMNTLNSGVSTVKSVGAMFGKLMVENPSTGLEVPNGRTGAMMSDSGSSNGQILPPTRSFSVNSETGSVNGRFTEQHYFIQYHYLKPARCDCCDDKLWGREYRCRGCGFQIHSRCTHEIVPGCSGKFKDSDSSSIRNVTPGGSSNHGLPPTPPAKQIMFGNNLQDQLELEQRSVPLVVEKCIEAVDERGLDVEGIYRRSGMAAEARQLVQAYDVGLQPDLMDDTLYQDICSITSVLKQYLRSLPEPLIPYDLYDDFMEAIGLPHTDSKYQVFQSLLERMPEAHYETLQTLLEHLNRVTEHDSVNLMHAKNLSVVFGPTLMRNPDPSREILDMVYKNMTIEFLIVNTSKLFGGSSERTSTSSSNGGAGSEVNGGSKEQQNGQACGGMDATAAVTTAAANTPNAPSVSPSATVTVATANGLPHGFTGQRQGSLGNQTSQSSCTPPPPQPPRRVPGHTQSPVLSQESSTFVPSLPPRSSSGEAVPTMNQIQQQQHHYNQHLHQQQQQQLQQQYHLQTPQQQQQQQQQQQFYRPQQFMPPQVQHQTLQQLKQQQQQREQQQREQQQQREEFDHQHQQQPSQPSLPPLGPMVSAATNHIVLEQQQQLANPEVDMSNFP
ncbi:hypothetical protein EDD11_000164 [Mortierella claussenii]|nr:hypothetical protein EDD11_000164 [Mortierella claussenii]